MNISKFNYIYTQMRLNEDGSFI